MDDEPLSDSEARFLRLLQQTIDLAVASERLSYSMLGDGTDQSISIAIKTLELAQSMAVDTGEKYRESEDEFYRMLRAMDDASVSIHR